MKKSLISLLLCSLAAVLLSGCQNGPSSSGSSSSSGPVDNTYYVTGDKIYSYPANYHCYV